MPNSSVQAETIPLTRCVGPRLGEGCQADYPNKDHAGLCARCLMLEGLVDNPREHAIRAAYPQCLDCGAAAKKFQLVDTRCGTCERLYKRSAGQEDEALIIAERQRATDFQARMKAGKERKKILQAASSAWNNPIPVASTSWKDITSRGPSHQMTTAVLENLRQSRNGSLGRMITVNIMAVINGVLAGWLPSHSGLHHCETQVDAVIEEYLRTLNAIWVNESQCHPLTREDVDLRWYLNRNLIPGSAHGTVADVFDIHSRDPSADVFFKNVPERWSHLRGESMCFELYIKRQQVDVSELTATSAQGKRQRPTGLMEGTGFKRLRREETSPATSDSDSTTQISLYIASAQVDDETGQVNIVWGTDDTKVAVLQNQSFAQGKTKKVYQLVLAGKAYVAKRFFEVGDGPESVSLRENAAQLENEFIRLKQGQWFLDKFYARAKETETEVSTNFIFSDGFLMREIIDDSGPSPASGVDMDSFLSSMDDDPDSAVIWLVEPLRGSSLERWSGTLQHPAHENKPGQTIDAFMHFSYVYSQQTLVFADIQGSKGRAGDGTSGWILFDIMTHTADGASGVGDHGGDGIRAILSEHICDRICCELNMGEENLIVAPKKSNLKTKTMKRKATKKSSGK
ncbi:kinase-like domain-containing protein [Mycena vitilis]|nr:kinase-like domain-containing protein [Mycena vitilis]